MWDQDGGTSHHWQAGKRGKRAETAQDWRRETEETGEGERCGLRFEKATISAGKVAMDASDLIANLTREGEARRFLEREVVGYFPAILPWAVVV